MEAFGWTPEYVRWELNGAEGWVYYNWARQNKASVWGTNERMTGDGYLKQEIAAILKKHGLGC